MNLLAIDTATERCSVAARIGGVWFERSVDTQRGHADIVLSMIDEVLREAGTRLAELEGLAYGRGPGAFTGVRIAVGVVQGLGFGAGLLTVGVSNLAAVAQQSVDLGEKILVCMDARMSEVYWSTFHRDPVTRLVSAIGPERLTPPQDVDAEPNSIDVITGSALDPYPALASRYGRARALRALPRARDILLLSERDFLAGRGREAIEAEPVYLRDQVTFVKTG